MKLISKLNKFFLVVHLIFLSIVSIAKSEIYNKIIVEGNQRLSIETVIIFSGLDTHPISGRCGPYLDHHFLY